MCTILDVAAATRLCRRAESSRASRWTARASSARTAPHAGAYGRVHGVPPDMVDGALNEASCATWWRYVHADDARAFRHPRGAGVVDLELEGVELTNPGYRGRVIEIGKGRILEEGTDVALIGYGTCSNRCLEAAATLREMGVSVTVADARFCKPLDTEMIRDLAKNHQALITVEEGRSAGSRRTSCSSSPWTGSWTGTSRQADDAAGQTHRARRRAEAARGRCSPPRTAATALECLQKAESLQVLEVKEKGTRCGCARRREEGVRGEKRRAATRRERGAKEKRRGKTTFATFFSRRERRRGGDRRSAREGATRARGARRPPGR